MVAEVNGTETGRHRFNQLVANEIALRSRVWQKMLDPRRDLDAECGYPPEINVEMYRSVYDREGIAARVVNIYPDECWAVDPEVYETEEKDLTPFEEDWQSLLKTASTNPYHYLHRADTLSGIGSFGILLLGLDDGLPLDRPVPNVDQYGGRVPDKKDHKLIFLRPFDQSLVRVSKFEADLSNPRFGQPTVYQVTLTDVGLQDGLNPGTSATTNRQVDVHWSRVIHLADNRESSEVFGVPRMTRVFNRVLDVRKILGSSAEMFYKGGFPGLSFEMNPDLVNVGVEMDEEKLKKQFYDYSNGLQRYIALVGLQTKSLAPQVSSPRDSLDAQMQLIAVTLGVPMRIFTGSEQAQLASGQDVRTWNRRLAQRHTKYITPLVLRPFIDRLIVIGCVRPPKYQYKVVWPDINMPTDDDKAQIADRRAAALMKFVMGGGYQLVTCELFLTKFLGFTDDEAAMMVAAAKAGDPIKIVPPSGNKGNAAGSGSLGGGANGQ